MSLLTTIPSVQIITTGRDYPLSTGYMTFTRENLADAVTAANTPGIVAPRLKLGHDDPRFNGGFEDLIAACIDDVSLTRDQYSAVIAKAARFEQMFDADPAIGRVTNMRLTDDGHTIVGDLEAVPTWLAEGLGSLYPGRSFEGDMLRPDAFRTNVTAKSGRDFSLVIDGVALLGMTQPAIRTLSDLRTLITGPLEETMEATTERVVASVATSDIVDAYQSLINGNPAYQSWWVRETVDNPDGLIVDTGDGLVLVTYTIDAVTDEPSFAVPQPVRRAYVDVTDTERVAAKGRITVVKANASVLEATPTEASVDPEQVQIRKDLGLAEDATAEDVTKRIAELTAVKPAEEKPDAEETATEPVVEENPAAGVTIPEGQELVDSGALQELKARAARVEPLEETQKKTDIERILASAMNEDGKFGPASANLWRGRLERDFDGAKADIAAMSPGLIPLRQRASAANGEVSTTTADLQARMDQHFNLTTNAGSN